jgi:hypothetical protein
MQARADELEKEGGPQLSGVALSTIQTYLPTEDRPPLAEPSYRFVVEAANILSVRGAWLAAGEGAPTEEAEAVRRAESPPAGLDRAVIEGFSSRLPFPDLAPAAQHALWRAWGVAARAVEFPPFHDQTPAWGYAIAERVAGSLAEVFSRFGLDPDEIRPFDLDGYLLTSAEALVRLLESAAPTDQPRVPRGVYMQEEAGE